MRRLVVCAALALAPAVAGCGGGDGGPTAATPEQQAEIEAALDDYRKAVIDRDAGAICDLLAEEVVAAQGAEACEAAFEQTLKEQGDVLEQAVRTTEVDHIDISVDGQIARVYPPDSTKFTRFVLEDGQWMLAPAAPDAAG